MATSSLQSTAASSGQFGAVWHCTHSLNLSPEQHLSLKQYKHVPSKPILVKEKDFYGGMDFDQEGSLVCLHHDRGTGFSLAPNGKEIRTYDVTACLDVWSVAIFDTKLAAIHADVTSKYDAFSALRCLSIYKYLNDGISFSTPDRIMDLDSKSLIGVAWMSNGRLIVLSNNSIVILDSKYEIAKKIEQGFIPHDIAVDIDNSFYVSDEDQPRIHHFNVNMRAEDVIECKDENGETFKPNGLAIDRINRRLFVCDYSRHRIMQLNGDCFVTWLNESDGISNPSMITVTRNATQLAIDQGPFKISLYDMQ